MPDEVEEQHDGPGIGPNAAELPMQTDASRVDVQPWDLQAGAAAWLKSAVDALSAEHAPLLKAIRREPLREIPDPEPVRTNDLREPLFKPMTLSHEWVASVDGALNFDVEEFLANVDSLAKAFADQTMTGMFGHIAGVAESYGQTVDATGRDNWDAILEALDRVEVSFSEDGTSNGILALHPDTYDKLMQTPPTPEQVKRADEQMQRKREEYFASRRTEELP